MNIKCVIVGNFKTNCYILEKENECLIIDPGDDFEIIKGNINAEVKGILITHNHFDHVGALLDCKNYYNVESYDIKNLKEGLNIIGSFSFMVNYNLGHTLDSISFIFDNIMFSGDFIFKDTIGRCDLGGDFLLMQDSIKNILKKDINYNIFPGHGDKTSFYNEKEMLKSFVK